MKSLKFLSALVLTGSLVMSVNSANANEELVAAGKAFAEKNCANCHAVGKEGNSRLPIAPPFRKLKAKYPLENLEEALAEGIVTNHPAMPIFQLNPDQIAALIEYLDSIAE